MNTTYFLTFPVKSLVQAANPHSCRAILTNLATVPGYQWEFYVDVQVIGVRFSQRAITNFPPEAIAFVL
ncbi:hypothetical protein NIES4106_59370 (plasmid) [Fischerella sp. NIES-4106]|nr:hypothetical protein NIES4106_59370 [Fischerella sp. NIES-4106]